MISALASIHQKLYRAIDQSLTEVSLAREGDRNNMSVAAALETILQPCPTFEKPSITDVQSLLPEIISARLKDDDLWLQFSGDVQFQQNKEIAYCLILFLQCTGHWIHLQSCPCLEEIRAGQLGSCLSIDSKAASAINLWPGPAHEGGKTHSNSIFGILSSHCQTSLGKKRVQQWLRHPSIDLIEITSRLEAVEQLVQSGQSLKTLCRQGLDLFGDGTADLAKLVSSLCS